MPTPSFAQVLQGELHRSKPGGARSARNEPTASEMVGDAIRRCELRQPRIASDCGPMRVQSPPREPLPACFELLGFDARPTTRRSLRRAFHREALIRHPDRPGGDHGSFIALQRAYEQALLLLGI